MSFDTIEKNNLPPLGGTAPLTVNLGERSYPIHIGGGLLDQPELAVGYLTGLDVMIVTNETIAPLYLERFLLNFPNHRTGKYRVGTIVLPDGEKHKNLSVLNRIFDELLARRYNRDCTLVALGGGVVGDTTGFATPR